MHEAGLCAKGKRRRVVTTRRDAPILWLLISYIKILQQPNRTEQKMGDRYHVYSYSTGVALSCSNLGPLFAKRGGMVDVEQMR
jgi:hypothetical protein